MKEEFVMQKRLGFSSESQRFLRLFTAMKKRRSKEQNNLFLFSTSSQLQFRRELYFPDLYNQFQKLFK